MDDAEIERLRKRAIADQRSAKAMARDFPPKGHILVNGRDYEYGGLTCGLPDSRDLVRAPEHAPKWDVDFTLKRKGPTHNFTLGPAEFVVSLGGCYARLQVEIIDISMIDGAVWVMAKISSHFLYSSPAVAEPPQTDP